MLYLPNALTILRVILVVPTVMALREHAYASALVLLIIAGLTDGLDGYLARRFDWHTRFGAILDPLADKIFAVSIYLTLGHVHLVPTWLVCLVVARDLLIVGGATAYRALFGHIKYGARQLSRLNTLLQVVLALVVVSAAAVPSIPQWLVSVLIWAVAATTALSGLDYVAVWGRRAWREQEHG